jgi:Xaa-Pro aminopeptidase
MTDVARIARAIREAGLSGWLFYNQFHRDEISDLALGIPRATHNTRPWAYVVPAEGEPTRIVHAIEPGILDRLPGRLVRCTARDELFAALGAAVGPGARLAAQFSASFPVCSFLDHGTAGLVERLGIELVSSEELIVDCLGTLDAEGEASHRRAALALHAVVRSVWARIRSAVAGGSVVHEADAQEWIAGLISEAGLETDGAALVAAGEASADPHYESAGGGRLLQPGDVVQLDLWAREPGDRSVYADISWVGVAAPRPTAEQERVFAAVASAREAAIAAIDAGLASGIAGADVDRAVRDLVGSLGYAGGLRHRTGHAIGTRVHGYGVNLDGVEFPDHRRLREGSCFSIEPGIYLERFGMRSEIDGLVRGGRLELTGGPRQQRLLDLGDEA